MPLRAVSGDAFFLERLASGCFSGRVHSVFGRVINIQGDDREWYGLTVSGLDQGPLSLRLLRQASLCALPVAVGDPAGLQNGLLAVGGLRVNFQSAQRWRGELPDFPCREAAAWPANLAALAGCIRQQGQPGGLFSLLLPESAGADLMTRQLRLRATALLAALTVADWPAAAACGLRLVGLGGGLTPSGDDFCSGLLTVFNLPAGPFGDAYREFGWRLAALTAGKTTDLGWAMLRQAAAGRARERVLDLLQAVATAATTSRVIDATAPVLAIGSLSGTDLAVGLYAGLDLGRQLQNRG